MMELAKMVTRLAARSGIGPWLRGVLFVAMACGVWLLWIGLDMASRFSDGVNLVVVATVLIGVANAIAILNHLVENDVRDRGWRHTAKQSPLALWAEMTDIGEDIRIWALLLWPLLVPGELIVCAYVVVAVVAAGISRVLNIRLK